MSLIAWLALIAKIHKVGCQQKVVSDPIEGLVIRSKFNELKKIIMLWSRLAVVFHVQHAYG